MITADTMRRAGEIAEGLKQLDRQADVYRFHKAIIDALNATHDTNHEQDLLALMDGFAHTFAQLLGGFDEDTFDGYLAFVVNRAKWLVDAYRADGNVARLRRIT